MVLDSSFLMALQNEWVICRVFQKSPGGKKIHISGFTRLSSYGNGMPPLMDSSPPHVSETRTGTGTGGETSHVTCFSDPMEDQKPSEEEMTDSFNSDKYSPSSTTTLQNSAYANQVIPNIGNLQYLDSFWMQDQCIFKMILENPGGHSKLNSKTEFSQDSVVSNPEMVQYPSYSAGPVDLGCLWSY